MFAQHALPAHAQLGHDPFRGGIADLAPGDQAMEPQVLEAEPQQRPADLGREAAPLVRAGDGPADLALDLVQPLEDRLADQPAGGALDRGQEIALARRAALAHQHPIDQGLNLGAVHRVERQMADIGRVGHVGIKALDVALDDVAQDETPGLDPDAVYFFIPGTHLRTLGAAVTCWLGPCLVKAETNSSNRRRISARCSVVISAIFRCDRFAWRSSSPMTSRLLGSPHCEDKPKVAAINNRLALFGAIRADGGVGPGPRARSPGDGRASARPGRRCDRPADWRIRSRADSCRRYRP